MKLNLFFLFLVLGSTITFAQKAEDKTDAKISSMPDFELSSEAKAAGIDGRFFIDVTVGKDGKASNVKVYGVPMWPCGKDIGDDLVESVRNAVKEHILSAKFEPATKNGKPKSSDVQVNFLLSEMFRKAGGYKQANMDVNSGISPRLVDLGYTISRYAISLPRDLAASTKSRPSSLVTVDFLVDENGDVVSVLAAEVAKLRFVSLEN